MKLHPYPCEGGGTILTNIAMLPHCTLKKMASDDGLFQYKDDKTFVGKGYIYSPTSRRVDQIRHIPTNTVRDVEIVMVYDKRGSFCMMPTECLEFPNPNP